MQHILQFWYLRSPGWFYGGFRRTLLQLEGHFAVRDTVRNLTKPIFQDYSFQGRLIGFVLRLARVLAGLLSYVLAAIIFILAYALWVLFPAICLVSLLGSFLGSSGRPL